MTTYFMSYARADQDIALRFADDLMASGCSIWVDQYDIRPSQHWDRAVETAVRGCHGLIVMLSPASSASSNVADEVAVAIEGGKDVIPVLLHRCTIPLRMSRMQFIDATENYDMALRRCLASIAKAAPAPDHDAHDLHDAPHPAAAPAAPVLPEELLKRAERRLTGLMGPISARLVKVAARYAETEHALYHRLAESIPDAAGRASFLGWMGPGESAGVATPRRPAEAPAETPGDAASAKELEAITHALARQIGPIAVQLVNRENRTSPSTAELCRRVAERIASPPTAPPS